MLPAYQQPFAHYGDLLIFLLISNMRLECVYHWMFTAHPQLGKLDVFTV